MITTSPIANRRSPSRFAVLIVRDRVFAHAAGKQDQPAVGSPTRAMLHACRRPRQRAGRRVRHRREQLDRILAAAARVARERLVSLPDRHRDACRARCPGDSTAAVRNVPCADVTSTTSPSPMPSFAAVAGIDLDPAAPHRRGQRIRHLLQPWQMRGEPSRNVVRRIRQEVEGILRRRRRRTRCDAADGARAAGLRGRRPATSAGGQRPHQPPFACASVHASPPSAHRRQRGERRRQHLVERLPRQLERRSRPRPISSSTSGVARVSCSGRITGGATLATASTSPTRAPPRSMIRGTSGPAGSDRPGRSSRPGSCRS